MPDYSKGQIYSVRFYDNDNIIYIGSTVQALAVRFGAHKRNSQCSLYQYIQEKYNNDFKACYIELIENFHFKLINAAGTSCSFCKVTSSST